MFKIITIISFLFVSSFFSLAQANVEQGKKLEKVSLQLQWLDQFQFAGYYMAKEKGFYKDAGLDVTFKKFKNIAPLEEVLHYNATYGIGRSSLLIDKSKGADIKLLAAVFQSSPSVFITTKDSNITNVKDFSGKKMMITDDASASVPLLAIAKREGLDTKSIKFLKHSFNINDLINKKTDLYSAYISNEPFLLKEKGFEINIFSPSELGFDFYDDILFTSSEEIKNHKQRAINFTRASLKGWEYAFSNIEETVEIILQKYNTQNKSREVLLYEAKELKKLAYVRTNSIGKIDVDNLRRIYDIYNLFGYIENRIDLEKLILKSENSDTLEFTREEKDYIKNNKTIRFTGDPNWLPFEAFNQGGKYIGIISEFLQHIEKQTDMSFKKIVSKDWADALTLATNGEVDVISSDLSDQLLKDDFKPIEPFMKTTTVIVMKNNYGFVDNLNDIQDKKIAIIKDYGYTADLYKTYPKVKFIEVKNIQEALLGVQTGKYDAALASLATSNYFILEMGLEDIGIVGKTDITMNVTLFIDKDKPLLHSILNKAIKSLAQKDRQAILRNWYQVHSAKIIDYDLLVKITLVLISIILLFVYRQYVLNKHNTKLKNLTKELQSSNEKLGKLTENVPGFVYQFKIYPDGHKTLPYVSNSIEEIFELTIQDVAKDAQAVFDRMHPDDLKMVEMSIQNSVETMNDWNVKFRVVLPQKGLRWLEGFAKLEKIKDGSTLAHGYIHDITEVKRKDELLLAQSRSAAMGEMIGMIAHQWRQPLASISMSMNNMLADIELEIFDTDIGKGYAQEVIEQNQHLSKTIDDFRNFFKPDKDLSTQTIEDVLEQTYLIIKNSLLNNNIELRTFNESTSAIEVYPRELMQVFVNIINNAKDALVLNRVDKAFIEIKVYENDAYVITDIYDNAKGIDENIITKIFDPYFSTKDEKNGTGLGLYMSKMIVENHLHGKIKAFNTEEGACFRVMLQKKSIII